MTTCALCGGRDAATITEYNGRGVPACSVCLAEVAEPEFECSIHDQAAEGSLGEAAMRAVGLFDGITARDLSEYLGVGGSKLGRNNVTVTLSRGVRRGLLRAEGPANGRLYYAVRKWTKLDGRAGGGKRQKDRFAA